MAAIECPECGRMVIPINHNGRGWKCPQCWAATAPPAPDPEPEPQSARAKRSRRKTADKE